MDIEHGNYQEYSKEKSTINENVMLRSNLHCKFLFVELNICCGLIKML